MVSTKITGDDFGRVVEERLRQTGLSFQRNVAVGGMEADFVVDTPAGRRVVLQAKSGRLPMAAAVERAHSRAGMYRRALGSDDVFVVVPGTARKTPAEGVLTLAGLTANLESLSAGPAAARSGKPGRSAASKLPTSPVKSVVFAVMPFAEEYDDTFEAMLGAAKAAKAVAKRVDREDYEGNVVERIHERLRTAAAVIADLSESKPNVFYEMGFAYGASKLVIPISSTPVDDLPFNVRNLNVIEYGKGQTVELRKKLAKRLKAALAGTANQ